MDKNKVPRFLLSHHVYIFKYNNTVHDILLGISVA